jgi:hypothetical protein
VATEREQRLDAVLVGRLTELLEPGGGGLGERLVRELLECTAPPPGERLVERLERLRGAGSERLGTTPDASLEPRRIQLVRAARA